MRYRRRKVVNRIVEVAEKEKEFVMLEDGFYYYWPKGHGAIPAYQLRELADELDKRNREWEENINQYFSVSNK